jgi:hypothetical protein
MSVADSDSIGRENVRDNDADDPFTRVCTTKAEVRDSASNSSKTAERVRGIVVMVMYTCFLLRLDRIQVSGF